MSRVPLPLATDDERGWCIFERGVSVLVMTCLAQAEAHGDAARYAAAQAAAPKLRRITSAGGVELISTPDANAGKMVSNVRAKLLRAKFTFPSDKAAAVNMLETIGVLLQSGIGQSLTGARHTPAFTGETKSRLLRSSLALIGRAFSPKDLPAPQSAAKKPTIGSVVV